MLWTIASIVIFILAIVVALNAMKDQRQKGKGSFSSFVIGCFTGGFFGGFLFLLLGVAAIFVN